MKIALLGGALVLLFLVVVSLLTHAYSAPVQVRGHWTSYSPPVVHYRNVIVHQTVHYHIIVRSHRH